MKWTFELKARIGLVFFGIFLALVLLEIGLRIAGALFDLKYYKVQNNQARYRIFCLGESTTFGVGTQDPAQENYPHQLELLFKQQFPQTKTRVFFSQTIGINTSTMLYNLPSTLNKFKPDVVIMMVGLNNWWNLSNSNVLLFNKHERLQNLYFRTLGFFDGFRVFKLMKWICYSTGLIQMDRRMVMDDVDVTDAGAVKKQGRQARRLAASLEAKGHMPVFFKVAEYDIRQMIRICRERKIKVVLCSYPGATFGALKRVHERVAREEGLVFVDNGSYFDALPDKPSYFTADGIHPNAAGYKLMAAYIFNSMRHASVVPKEAN
ncbi:MAG: hypothetical protein HQL17_04450 [Candidatus Omnitrophica bacterium]|nr:hypothetical protein [Candidatus Omnitrophota bacterium]